MNARVLDKQRIHPGKVVDLWIEEVELPNGRTATLEVVRHPGAAAGAFIKQYHQAGLKDVLPLYSVFTVDAISLPKLQAAGFQDILGSKITQER